MKPKLTARERQICELMKAGTTRRKEIAVRLGVTVNTIDSFLARIRLKTGKTR